MYIIYYLLRWLRADEKKYTKEKKIQVLFRDVHLVCDGSNRMTIRKLVVRVYLRVEKGVCPRQKRILDR